MKLHPLSRPLTLFALAAAALASSGITSAASARSQALSEAEALYRSELAVCARGESNQDRSTCVYEAKSAYAQNRRGALADGGADYKGNANERCAALEGSERVACASRMAGQGTVSGTVQDGGVLRELTTRSVVAPAPIKRRSQQPANDKPVR